MTTPHLHASRTVLINYRSRISSSSLTFARLKMDDQTQRTRPYEPEASHVKVIKTYGRQKIAYSPGSSEENMDSNSPIVTPKSKVQAMLRQLDDQTAQGLQKSAPQSLYEKLRMQLDVAKKRLDDNERSYREQYGAEQEDLGRQEDPTSDLFVPSSPVEHTKRAKEQEIVDVSTPNIAMASSDDIIGKRPSRQSLGDVLSSPTSESSNSYMQMFFESPEKPVKTKFHLQDESQTNTAENERVIQENLNSSPIMSPTFTTASSPQMTGVETETLSKPRKVKGLSKKELEMTARETQRMERELKLAHEMHTTMYVSVKDFLNDFDNEANSDPSSPRSKEPSSPATSPLKEAQVAQVITPEKPKSDSPFKHLQTPHQLTKSSLPKETPVITPRRLTSFVNSHKFQHKHAENPDLSIAHPSRDPVDLMHDSSDSDLEIIPQTTASKLPKAIRRLGNLAKIDIYGKEPNTPAAFLSLLAQKQAQQAKKAKEERIADLKKKGIEINEDENIKEKELLEDLLEVERRKAEELARKERTEEDDNLDDDEEWGESSGENHDDEVAANVYRSENEEDSEIDVLEESEEEGEMTDTDNVDDDIVAETQAVNHEEPQVEVPSSMVIEDSEKAEIPKQTRRMRKVIDDDDEDDIEIISQAEQATQASSLSTLLEPTQDQTGGSIFHGTSEDHRPFQSSIVDVTQPVSSPTKGRGFQVALSNDSEDEDVFVGKRLGPRTRPVMSEVADDSIQSDSSADSPMAAVPNHGLLLGRPKMHKKRAVVKISDEGKAFFDQEAEESEDEWNNGAKSDNDEENEDVDDYQLAGLVDDSTKERVDTAQIQQLDIEDAQKQDDALIHKLMDDVTNGGWRKRRAANGLLGDDLFDMDEDSVEYMMQLQRRAERKRQKLLEEERLSEIVNNEKAKAFVESIAEETTSTVSFLGEPVIEEEDDTQYSAQQSEAAENLSSEQSSDVRQLSAHAPAPRKKFSIDSIRKSLSFLDDEDDSDKVAEESNSTQLNDDYVPQKIVMIDRRASQIASVASRAESEIDTAMPPPRLPSMSTRKSLKIDTPDVQILRSLSSSKMTKTMRSGLVRQKTAPSLAAPSKIPSQSPTRRVLTAKKQRPKFFQGGSFE